MNSNTNSFFNPANAILCFKLEEDAQSLLRMAISELYFSARAYDRILKVARTIADLAGSEQIESEHISEAIQYRTLDRQFWI